jgi:hypothetical protein
MSVNLICNPTTYPLLEYLRYLSICHFLNPNLTHKFYFNPTARKVLLVVPRKSQNSSRPEKGDEGKTSIFLKSKSNHIKIMNFLTIHSYSIIHIGSFS